MQFKIVFALALVALFVSKATADEDFSWEDLIKTPTGHKAPISPCKGKAGIPFPSQLIGVFSGSISGVTVKANISKFNWNVTSSANKIGFSATLSQAVNKSGSNLILHKCVTSKGKTVSTCVLIALNGNNGFTEYASTSNPSTCPTSTSQPKLTKIVWMKKPKKVNEDLATEGDFTAEDGSDSAVMDEDFKEDAFIEKKDENSEDESYNLANFNEADFIVEDVNEDIQEDVKEEDIKEDDIREEDFKVEFFEDAVKTPTKAPGSSCSSKNRIAFPQQILGAYTGSISGSSVVANISKFSWNVTSATRKIVFTSTLSQAASKSGSNMVLHKCVTTNGKTVSNCVLLAQNSGSNGFTEYVSKSSPSTCPTSTNQPNLAKIVWAKKHKMEEVLE